MADVAVEFREATAELARRDEARARVLEAQDELAAARDELAAAEAAAMQESVEVDELKGFSFKGIAARLRGERDARLIKEEGERRAAEGRLAQARDHFAAARVKVDQLAGQLAAFDGAEARVAAARVALRESRLDAAKGDPELDELTAQIAALQQDRAEVLRRSGPLARAREPLEGLLEDLGKARRASMDDRHDLGFRGWAKYEFIQNASLSARDAEQALRDLPGGGVASQLASGVGQNMDTAREHMVADGIIGDRWGASRVHASIEGAQSDTEELLQRVDRMREANIERLGSLERQLEELERRRDQVLLRADLARREGPS